MKPIYKTGSAVAAGVMLGAFVGLLLHKLALGAIFGFFIGIAVDAARQRQSAPRDDEHSMN